MRESPLPSHPLVALGPSLDADGLRPAPLNLRRANPRSRLRPNSMRSRSLRSHARTGLAVVWLDAHALVWSAATVFLCVRYDALFLFVHDAALDVLFCPSAASLER